MKTFMKVPVQKFSACILVILLLTGCMRNIQTRNPERDGAQEALERDIKMMKDPALGYVPAKRLLAAKEYKDQLVQQINGPLAGVNWKEQGPNNLGGRSRAILADAGDVSGNTVFVGSVGGGLWKTTNMSAASPTWVAVNDFFTNLAITSIAQDPTNALVMYFCIGEGYFNFDAIQGDGVWKSTDGGATWAQLASTTSATFDFCQKIIVNSTGIGWSTECDLPFRFVCSTRL